jgi:hypothetical protein
LSTSAVTSCGLQRPERLGRADHVLEALRALLDRLQVPAVLEPVELALVLDADQACALLAHRSCLVLDHREQPPVRRRRVEAMRTLDEDLQRPLIRVLRVGRTARVPPRQTQQRLGMLGDRRHDELLRILTAATVRELHDRHEGDPPENSPPRQRGGPVSERARRPRTFSTRRPCPSPVD